MFGHQPFVVYLCVSEYVRPCTGYHIDRRMMNG